MGNPNDSIRDAILRELYEVHGKAKSPTSAAIGIQPLQKAMKTEHGLKQQDVASNLDYLIQKGWAVAVVEERTFRTPTGTTQQAPKKTYKISDVGIDHLEGASTFQRDDLGARVNITNVHGVTVVGDGNVVNANYAELSRTIDQLRDSVLAADELDDEEKLNTVADLETLQTQLQKPTPDKSIVKRAWAGVQAVVTVGELAQLSAQAAALLAPLLS